MLAQALEVNTSLTALTLRSIRPSARCRGRNKIMSDFIQLLIIRTDCEVGDNGAIRLAKALEHNSSLTFLDLSGALRNPAMRILNTGADRSVHLFPTGLKEQGFECFAKLLKSNTTLTSLNLGDGVFRDELTNPLQLTLQLYSRS